MGKYNGAVITTAGQNVISQAISGTELTWLTMKTSSIAIPAGTNIESLTTLSGIEQTSKITDASVYGNNVIQLSARFSNTNIATEYYIQTVGIYGQLTGGNETLIAVMTAVTPDEMPVYDPDAPSAFIFNAQITVQNAKSVTMTVNDTGTATVADLNRKLDKTGDASDATIGSSTASTESYPIPAVNDTFKVILGKIIKWFGDMSALVATKFNAANVYNGLDKTESGYALDARQGKALNDTKLNVANVVNNVTTTNEGYALDARVGKSINDYMRVHYDSSYELALPSGTTGALLDTINTLRTQSKEMPFCIQKDGFASISDLPSNITATEEFQVLVFGSTARWTVILVRFSPQSTGAIFLRNGWRDAWFGGWGQINIVSVG